jgi:hypothetical protein
MGWCGVRGVKRRSFHIGLWNRCDGMGMKHLVLEIVSIFREFNSDSPTQLEFGSRNLHQTPSFRTSSILLHLFKKTANMRFRRSMICWSCFAFVGLAA